MHLTLVRVNMFVQVKTRLWCQRQIQNVFFKWQLHLLRERGYSNLSALWGSNCPLNLITVCATSSSNNCNKSFTSLEECWPPLLSRIVLIQSHWWVFEHEQSCLRSGQNVSIWFKSRLWTDHFKTFILVFGLAGVFLIVVLLSSFRTWTDGWTFSFMVSRPSPEEVKQPETITLSPPCVMFFLILC